MTSRADTTTHVLKQRPILNTETLEEPEIEIRKETTGRNLIKV